MHIYDIAAAIADVLPHRFALCILSLSVLMAACRASSKRWKHAVRQRLSEDDRFVLLKSFKH